MFGAESFALHFLEDSFSAGHIVGTWGSGADRKGTHDYYSEYGVDAHTWAGDEYPAYGDAFMRQTDLDHAARAAATSLGQVLDVLSGNADAPESTSSAASLADATVCASRLTAAQLRVLAGVARSSVFLEVLEQTPQPSRRDPHLPRHPSEIGVFFRGYSAARLGAAFGGYEAPQFEAARAQGALEVGVGLGVGLEGLTTSTTDGLLWIQGSITSHSAEQDSLFCGTCPHQSTPYTRVPERFGFGGRIRAPFYLLPGDLLFPGIFIELMSPRAFERMALEAARGTLLRWQSIIPLPWGSFQFILGREVGVYSMETARFTPPPGAANQTSLKVDSVELELPIAELSTTHAYAGNLGGSLVLQSGVAMDFNQVGDALLFYVKVAFDGRAYLTKF